MLPTKGVGVEEDSSWHCPGKVGKCGRLADAYRADDNQRERSHEGGLVHAPANFRPSLVEGFLYAFGNLPVVVGRNEMLLMLSSVPTLQDMFLLPLLYDENGIDPKGGLKRMSRRLTREQQELLGTMPPLRYELEALIDANYWLARTFLTRARALAARLDADYPTTFEQATIRHVERSIGVPLGI